MHRFNQSSTKGWASLRLACACLLLWPSLAGGDPAAVATEITSFGDYYALAPEPALRGVPVRFRGVVVGYDRDWNQLYIHDGVQTAWFSPKSFPTNLQAGLQVEITGTTTFTQGSLAFTNLHLQVLGPGNIPVAKRLTLLQLGSDFGQWVESEGRVRVVDISPGRLSLVIQDQRQTCLVYVMGLPTTNNYSELLGCQVRIRGINASKSVGGQLESASIFASGLNEICILEQPPAKTPLLPVSSVESLLNRKLGAWTNTPVHLNGLLVAYKPGESLVVKDVTGTIRAQVIQTTEVSIDSRVDVWGYLTVGPGEAILRDAYFAIPPPPAAKTISLLPGESGAEPAGNHLVLTRFADVSKLRPEVAAQGIPVRLQGTVIFADLDWRICFIQGQDGAIYANLDQAGIQAGQWVEVTGQTSAGGFAPEVARASFRVLATTNLPPPVKTDLGDLAYGNLDAHWVQLEGVVRRVTEQWGHVTLLLTTPKGRFKAIVPKPEDQAVPANLIDSLVSVRGACSSAINQHGQLTGISLHVPSYAHLSILEPVPADPFAMPTTAINAVATFDPKQLAGRRVKVNGTVTLVLPGQGFYLQKGANGIRANCTQTNALQIGDTVNVLGFPAINDFSPYLEEVSMQPTGTAPLPEPLPTTAEEILRQGTNDATRVQIEAQLIQDVTRSAHPKLVLQSGAIVFTATITAQAGRQVPDFQIGSTLRLAGICAIQGGEFHDPETFRLLVASPQDVVLLRSPPWWTIRHTIILVISLAVAILLAWWWSSSLHRQVEAQTEIIRRNEQELMAVSRQAGMAEVATAVLHNVGNVLNSVNVSASLAMDKLRESKVAGVSQVADLMDKQAANLGHFITHDVKGRQLPNYLGKLGEHLTTEKKTILTELDSLTKNIQHIKDIVARQQSYAKVGGVTEKIQVTDLIDDALKINEGGLETNHIQVIREYGTARPLEIFLEKHKVLQILVNLISNAKNACGESDQSPKQLTIRVTHSDARVQIAVADNGVGIPPENLTRIFGYGFTTRKKGHGFGLHSAALAAKELGGTLQAQSEGSGKGATFTLELPLVSPP